MPLYARGVVRGFQNLDELTCTHSWIGREENVADHRNRIRTRSNDFGGALRGDSSDRHDGLVRQRPNLAYKLRSDHGIRVHLGRRGKDRPHSNIVRRSGGSLLELRAIVCRDTNELARCDDSARFFNAQVFLADMSAACACKGRSEEHTSELQSHLNLVCRLLLENKTESPATTHLSAEPP